MWHDIETWALIEQNKDGTWRVTKVADDPKELEGSFGWSAGFFGINSKIVKVKISPKLDKLERMIVKKAR